MIKMREVIENDFRKDEFKGKNPKDYEFRDDGAIVRKDRWEMGIRRIASIFKYSDFEIEDMIEDIQLLKDKEINENNT